MPTFTMELGQLLTIPYWKTEWQTTLEAYPIFSEDYREHLNTVIEEHYLNREIGTETPDQFLFHVQRLMRRKMPLINRMYVQTMRDIDPLVTQDILTSSKSKSTSSTASEGESASKSEGTTGTTSTGEAASTSSGEGKTKTVGTNKSRAVASNAPGVRLAGNADYASGMSDSTAEAISDADTSESGKTNSTEKSASDTEQSGKTDTTEKGKSDTIGDAEGEARTKGYTGLPGDLLSSYYDSLINVDEMVLDFLAPCFMQIVATNHPFTIER